MLTALGQYKDPAAISVEFTEVLGLEQSTKLVQGDTRVNVIDGPHLLGSNMTMQ